MNRSSQAFVRGASLWLAHTPSLSTVERHKVSPITYGMGQVTSDGPSRLPTHYPDMYSFLTSPTSLYSKGPIIHSLLLLNHML